MGAPNPDDPLANDVAQHWKTDEKAAIQQGTRIVNLGQSLLKSSERMDRKVCRKAYAIV